MASSALITDAASAFATAPPPLRDSYGRAILDLRLSITDRCNYRCLYCRDGKGLGEIGIIAPVSRPFCGACSRIRVNSSDGKIRTCLFSQSEQNLSSLMHQDATDETMATYIRHRVNHKEARHHIGEDAFARPSRSMVHIGG